jgi:hypothetical protein
MQNENLKDTLYSFQNRLVSLLVSIEEEFSLCDGDVIKTNEEIHLDYSRKNNKMIEYFFLKEEKFQEEQKKEKFIQELKEKFIMVEKIVFGFTLRYAEFKYECLQLKLLKINKRTLKKYFEKIENQIHRIMELLYFIQVPSYDLFLKRKKAIGVEVSTIIQQCYLIMNLIFEDIWYKKEVDFTKIKKLSFDEINEGDVIVLRKDPSLLSSFRLFAKKLLDSNFIHSAIVYRKTENSIFLFESLAYDKKEVGVNILEKSKNLKYIILRPNKDISKKNLETLRFEADKYLGTNYSFLKVLGAFVERHKEQFFENSRFPFFRKKNPFSKNNGIFCSELVALIYSKIGIKIGFTEDNSIVSPLDILNSSSLKIIGYYE